MNISKWCVLIDLKHSDVVCAFEIFQCGVQHLKHFKHGVWHLKCFNMVVMSLKYSAHIAWRLNWPFDLPGRGGGSRICQSCNELYSSGTLLPRLAAPRPKYTNYSSGSGKTFSMWLIQQLREMTRFWFSDFWAKRSACHCHCLALAKRQYGNYTSQAYNYKGYRLGIWICHLKEKSRKSMYRVKRKRQRETSLGKLGSVQQMV